MGKTKKRGKKRAFIVNLFCPSLEKKTASVETIDRIMKEGGGGGLLTDGPHRHDRRGGTLVFFEDPRVSKKKRRGKRGRKTGSVFSFYDKKKNKRLERKLFSTQEGEGKKEGRAYTDALPLVLVDQV